MIAKEASMDVTSRRTAAAADEMTAVFDFFNTYREGRRPENVKADLTFGNPHEMPLKGLVAALDKAIRPKDASWFAYKTSEAEPCEVIAAALQRELGLKFAPEDIAMTQGAFGAIALAFSVLLNPGDECILPWPGWFCYPSVLRGLDAIPVKVPLDPSTYDLDLGNIEAALTPRSRVVIVNTPHNPTGVIYTRERLVQLAALLERKSAEFGRRIFILSDEPYRRIRLDGADFTSPAEVYPWTLIDYSYGKVLLAPGLRLGYLAVCPNMPAREREELQRMIKFAQVSRGWAFPDSPLQYAVGDLETLSIDIKHLEEKRDRLLSALLQWGYEMTRPQGTFYLWGRAPGGDATAFTRALAEQDIFVMPGTLFECPGDFRISLTATSAMIEASLPAFQALATGFRGSANSSAAHIPS
jgi:aspartate aminotransferase